MITDRWYEPEDYSMLEISLAGDEFHKDTKPEFFTAPGTVCKVYEKNGRPVLFLRGTKAIRIDIQFVDNSDHESNREVMETQFDAFVKKCKEQGFTELIFNTTNKPLEIFCRRRLGFQKSGGELRKFI